MSFFKSLKKDDISFSFAYYDGEVDWYSFSSNMPVSENIRDILTGIAIYLAEKYNIDQLYSETEYQSITLELNPSKNKMFYSVRCENFEGHPDTYSDDIRDEEVLEFIKEKGIESVRGYFSGYGDSGEIHEDIEINGKTKFVRWGGEYEKLLNYLYDRLEAAFGGWEIDDGSRGEFEIEEIYGKKMISINQVWNTRVWDDCQDPIEITEDTFEE